MTSSLHAEERITVKTRDTGAALVNPGMGWTMHFYSNVPTNYGSKLAPADTLDDFPGLSTVYRRLPWAFLEPEEGKYNWAILEHQHYGGSKKIGAWSGELLLKSVEDYHASFMSIDGQPRQILTENRDTIDQINLRMGYRLQPLEVIWPKTVEITCFFPSASAVTAWAPSR